MTFERATVPFLASVLTVSLLALVVAVVPAAADEAAILAPGDNLDIRRVPPIPLELAESARRYSEIRSAGFASWHPTRREMLISTRFADASQIHRVRVPGGAREQVTFFREPVRGADYDKRSGESFIFAKDTGGDEFYQIYRFDLRDGSWQLLSDGEKRNAPGEWSQDGSRYAYSRVDADPDGAFTKLFVVRPFDFEGGREVTTLEGGGWGVVDWFPGDEDVLLSRYRSINQSSLWRVDAASGEVSPVSPDPAAGEAVAWRGGEISKDGKTIWATTDAGSEFRQLVELDVATRSLEVLTGDIPWDVSSISLSPDGKTLAFTVNEEGYARLFLYDVANGERTAVSTIPNGVFGGVSWHDNGRDLAFVLSSARSSGDVYSVDAKTQEVTRWTRSETGGLDPSRFSEPELVRWPAHDGLSISGFLYRPPARFTGPRPVIVNIHGGPEGQSRPTFKGRSNYYIEELGIAVIYPNVRGSSGFGKTFVMRDNGFKREGSYEDIDALFDWIEKDPGLDASRILVTGGSYGGHMTFATATRYNDRICCSIAVVGISNLRTFLENTQGYRRDLRRVEYGDERDPEMYAFLEKIAPLNHVADIEKPIFLVHGRNDPRVPVSESDQIIDMVHERGVPAWYLVAEDEGHGFRKRRNADYQFYSTILFVKKFLLGEEVGGATASGGR